MNEKEDGAVKKYKLVPPDGGWGYAICLSMIIITTTTTVFFQSMGMIFYDFLIELKMDSTGYNTLNALTMISFAITGYATGPMSKLMTHRKLCFLGSFLNFLGNMSTFWAKSQLIFYISQIFVGLGCGFLYNVSVTVLNDYFLEKRLLSMTVGQTIPAVIGLVIPMFVKWTLDEYGYRGTFLYMAGFSVQNFIAAALMQPVEWHLKKVAITDDDKEEATQLLEKKSEDLTKSTTREQMIMVKMSVNDEELNNENINRNAQNLVEDESKESWIQRTLHILDLNLLKDIHIMSAAIGLAFCAFADATFILMLPQALYSMHWDKETIAWSIVLYSIGDLATRFILITFSKPLEKIGNKIIYMFGLAITVITKIGMLGSTNVNFILAYLTIMGVSKCTINTMYPIVLSDCVPTKHFSQALGISLMVIGISNVLLGPVIGAVRDMTNSYSASFYILTSFFAIVLLFWSIELCYLRNQKREAMMKKRIKRKPNRTK